MPYRRFNNLAKLLNGDLTAQTGRGILSIALMGGECICCLPSKVNGECVHERKFLGNF